MSKLNIKSGIALAALLAMVAVPVSKAVDGWGFDTTQSIRIEVTDPVIGTIAPGHVPPGDGTVVNTFNAFRWVQTTGATEAIRYATTPIVGPGVTGYFDMPGFVPFAPTGLPAIQPVPPGSPGVIGPAVGGVLSTPSLHNKGGFYVYSVLDNDTGVFTNMAAFLVQSFQ